MAVKGGGSENENYKEAKADKREESEGSDTQRKSRKGREISGKVESKGDGRIRKNEEADRKQKKEYVKEKKVYNKTETKEENSVDDFGKEICLEMVRAVNMCREFERGCDEFSLYLVYCKEEVARWQGDWRVANVMETYDEWRARRNIDKVEAKRKRQEIERILVRREKKQESPAPGTRRIWCSECDQYLAGGPSHLQCHKDTVHLGLRPWECDGCDSKFGSKGELEKHISLVHLGQRFYSCTVEGCGKSFRHNTYLKDHGRAEHNHPRLCCPDCTATYAWTSDLNKHRRKHRDFFWA